MEQQLESYQQEIYRAGTNGSLPMLPADLAMLEDLAADRLSPEAFGFFSGGAGSGDTVAENMAAFRRWRIVPRLLTDVSAPSYASTVLGTSLPAPMLLAPVAALGLAHAYGELAVAHAAAALGVPMILSSAASATVEEVALASGSGQRWYQLYWPKDRALAASLLQRAAASGFTVLVVTLDLPVLGWRPRDLDHGFSPFLRGLGIQNYLADPAFLAAARTGSDVVAGQAELIERHRQTFTDPRLTWSDLPFLRQHWDGPIVLKGVLSAADARLAVDAGMDGIVVSNHGGRQLDGAVAALDALPDVAAAAGPAMPVLFDSGIRGGADMVKALALGARAVLIGRPYAYGLALGGEGGVRHVLRVLRNDFELTMRAAGLSGLGDLSPRLLRRSDRG